MNSVAIVAIVAMFFGFMIWQLGANGGTDHPALIRTLSKPVLMELPEPANTTTVEKTWQPLK